MTAAESDKAPSAAPVLVIYALIIVGAFFMLNSSVEKPIDLPYSTFLADTKQGILDNLVISDRKVTGQFVKGKDAGKRFTSDRIDQALAEKLSATPSSFKAAADNGIWQLLGNVALPLIFLGVLWSMLSRGARDGMTPGFMSIERSGAKIYHEEKVKITFADVAGVDEAKEELEEVLNFLKHPERYKKLGGHLPKGILLVGPPGTGKTLLARAVAGEAGVPFFSISGSQFVELFVGVGAARVRDLFAQAAKSAPCIIFIDELDALGKARGMASGTSSHDEKEQTLNQLLVELDGFDPMQGIVLLAATNRPEMLDPALLRAGRFDRHVLVDRPDKTGRIQILNVHVRDVKLDSSVDLETLAASTPGFTGADLANLVNEATLLAVRRNAETVQMSDFTQATERIVAGLEKKNRLLNARERQIVAFHECGHALISIALPGCEVVQKISIIPRGIGALGYTMHRPIEDRYLMSKEELENKMTTLLGGRAAELLVFQQLSTGASDDLLKATDIARSMITRYGMSSELGPVTLEPESKSFLPVPVQEMLSARQYSEETARQIDSGVRTMLEEAHARALAILSQRRDLLELSATRLLEKETITGVELAALVSEKNQAGSLKAAESAPDASSETASQSQLSFIASES